MDFPINEKVKSIPAQKYHIIQVNVEIIYIRWICYFFIALQEISVVTNIIFH